MIKWIFAILIFPCLALSMPQIQRAGSPSGSSPATLDLVFEGPHLSLYTSGRLLRQDRHPKSGVWNTPARKVLEMWVKRTGDEQIVRLAPESFRSQLLGLLADFPEIHGAIHHRSFTYKNLSGEIPKLNAHISKVIDMRKERRNFRAK